MLRATQNRSSPTNEVLRGTPRDSQHLKLSMARESTYDSFIGQKIWPENNKKLGNLCRYGEI